MHSVFARINGVSSFLSTCLMAFLAAVALSSLFLTADPKGRVDVVSLKVSVFLPLYNAKAKRYPFKEQEFGFLKFDIDAGTSCLLLFPLLPILFGTRLRQATRDEGICCSGGVDTFNFIFFSFVTLLFTRPSIDCLLDIILIMTCLVD
ncbi:hypothetical protein ID866_7761 [Astraeus odoratus]|nr:hypothetical protein ID866_7761 [Astraeus odoratus]